MDRGGTTPLFLHASTTSAIHALTSGAPSATASHAGKAEMCLRSP